MNCDTSFYCPFSTLRFDMSDNDRVMSLYDAKTLELIKIIENNPKCLLLFNRNNDDTIVRLSNVEHIFSNTRVRIYDVRSCGLYKDLFLKFEINFDEEVLMISYENPHRYKHILRRYQIIWNPVSIHFFDV